MKSDFIISYPGFFVSEFHDETLWLKFSGNFFHNLQCFDRNDFLQEYFTELAADREIRTVVMHSAFSESGHDEYLRFFLFDCPEQELGHFGFSNTMNRYELHRFCNIVDQTVLAIRSMDKMFIHICTGDVISLFMNISLSCDYRIITNDTVFHNIYQEIGMLPKGGPAYFLSKTIGEAKAKQYLLQRYISSSEALAANIANEAVDSQDLENRAMEVASYYNSLAPDTLMGIKKLANYNQRDLKDYLQYETELIVKLGQKKGFGEE